MNSSKLKENKYTNRFYDKKSKKIIFFYLSEALLFELNVYSNTAQK